MALKGGELPPIRAAWGRTCPWCPLLPPPVIILLLNHQGGEPLLTVGWGYMMTNYVTVMSLTTRTEIEM